MGHTALIYQPYMAGPVRGTRTSVAPSHADGRVGSSYLADTGQLVL